MMKSIPTWIAVCAILVSIAAGVGIDRLALWYHHEMYTPFMKRDLNELYLHVQLGMKRQNVIEELGPPVMVASSPGDLVPYDVSPPKAEKVLLYGEYPWGILVYVDEKDDRVSRIMLVRHP